METATRETLVALRGSLNYVQGRPDALRALSAGHLTAVSILTQTAETVWRRNGEGNEIPGMVCATLNSWQYVRDDIFATANVDLVEALEDIGSILEGFTGG